MAQNDSGSGIAWFIGGALLGAGVALLLAPASGEETRKLISNTAKKGGKALNDSSQEVFQRGKELYERGRELAEDAAELFERGRKIAEKKFNDAV